MPPMYNVPNADSIIYFYPEKFIGLFPHSHQKFLARTPLSLCVCIAIGKEHMHKEGKECVCHAQQAVGY